MGYPEVSDRRIRNGDEISGGALVIGIRDWKHGNRGLMGYGEWGNAFGYDYSHFRSA